MSLSPCDIRTYADGTAYCHACSKGNLKGPITLRAHCPKLVTPPPDTVTDRYAALRAILDAAYQQAAFGKGSERHANGRPWTEQPIATVTRACGLGFPGGQGMKKIGEAMSMAEREEFGRAYHELLGAIVYIAYAALVCRDAAEKQEGGK